MLGVFTAADLDLPPLGVGLPGLIPDAMARPVAGHRHRALRRRAGRRRRDRDAGPGRATRPSSSSSTTSRCPRSSTLQAAATDEVLLFPEHGTNTAVEIPFGHTGDELFAGCEVVVRQPVINQRLAACPLEPRGVATAWDDGRLVFWASTQAPHGVKDKLAGHYGLDAGPGARHRPRRRRRLRRQDRRPARRAAAAVGGPPARPAGALGRDPPREHGGDAPRPGPGQRRRDRRPAATAPSRPTASPCCRTPAPTRAWAPSWCS